MQYAHRRLHRSVSDTRRSVAIRPKESGSIVPAYAGQLRQLRVPVHHHVGPEVTAGDMEADPRVTAHVAGLGPVVRGGDPDGLFLRVPGVVHVGQLWPPVFSEGDQYSLPLPGNQLSKPTLDHAKNNRRRPDVPDTGRI